MNENTTKRREWIKNAAIVFLAVLLVLTFFSNTIMNYSLPEVATQTVTSQSITAKVRGTGTVEASDPYNVTLNQSRVIASVAVKQGDTVEKGDVLFYLEDAESTELKEAQAQLDTLRTNYEKAILAADSSSSIVEDVESGKTSSTESKLAQIDSYNARIDSLTSQIDSYNTRIAEIDAELSKMGEATVDTSGEQQAVNNAAAELAKAEAAVTAAQDKLTAAQSTLTAASSAVSDAQKTVDDCQTAASEADNLYAALVSRRDALKKKETDGTITESERAELAQLEGDGAGSINAASQAKTEAANNLAAAQAELDRVTASSAQDIANAQAAVDAAQTEYNKAVTNKQNCENKKAEADRNLANKQASRPDTSRQDSLNSEKADLTLKVSQATTQKTEAEGDLQELLAGYSKEVDLVSLLQQIRDQEEVVQKLQESATGATVEAPVSGMVSQINYVAGETTSPEQALAQIVVTEKGYTVKFSVTNDQARQISVGDVAEIQNSWAFSDVTATVAGFQSDPSNPQNRQVVFDVTGEVQAGQTMTLSVGQRSANYDYVVPNSAIREDNNGKFILIVESKSSPLGNRYIATRVDVEVLASDDTMSAISGGLYGYEYVITTSTAPVEAGQQVRLADQ